jgi:predicted metal-dependent HD superfamily phosphohydrolase
MTNKWSRITDHDLAKDAVGAIKHYTESLGLSYHNYSHVQSMYDYLERTDEPYDEALDWAVLFHDIVYDKEPEKEKRSAIMLTFNGSIPKYGVDREVQGRAVLMIMATTDHVVSSPDLSAIVRADLHGLADVNSAIRNFANIMEESCNLYSIDPEVFASQSAVFMQGLRERVQMNVERDPKHREFYKSVLNGIDLSVALANLVKGENQ